MEDYSSHIMQDDWREQNPYPHRSVQWHLQELRLKIRARQGNRIGSERKRQICEIFAEMGTKEEYVSVRDGEPNEMRIWY